MADCTETSKRIAETVDMEQANMNLSPKRTKCDSLPLKETTNNVAVSLPKTASFGCLSDEFSSSRYSSNGSPELVKDGLPCADLEEISTCEKKNCYKRIRKTTSLREVSGDSEETSPMNSLPENQPPISPPRSSPEEAEKMPSREEIEEFFSKAEKIDQKRFMEKYNYDIVKDVALKGRYQWTRINP